MLAMIDSSSLRSGSGREAVVKRADVGHGVPTLRPEARAGCKGPILGSVLHLFKDESGKSAAARSSNRERRQRQPHFAKPDIQPHSLHRNIAKMVRPSQKPRQKYTTANQTRCSSSASTSSKGN